LLHFNWDREPLQCIRVSQPGGVRQRGIFARRHWSDQFNHHSGARRELVLVRTVDIGGNTILDALEALSGESRASVMIALHQEDEMMIENGRVALMNLSREIASSIGFLEARREEKVGRTYVSGGAAKSRALLKILTEEVHLPCEGWNPLAGCDISVAANQRARLSDAAYDLHVAYGAAAELINS
jgi:Tfp pilus assembly PilM family ATPase